ncbi:amino acid adenylation domain-containing protein [Kribbella sp. NPDC051952]|uniref:non-ribosomal peptide synthetase/type I polyketide synthase n=1 Tax=Kribbella sp. NPDC051952 TaxID=3154851 RepID=UPI003447DA89
MRSGVDRPAISTGPALMIPAGYPRDLPSALLRAARDFGTAGVVEIGPDGRETKLDFPTLLELAARILAGLRANGVRAGDPAVVHCTEPVGFFASFWACTLGGIRPLLMAPSPEGDRTEAGRERLRKVTDLLGWTVLIGRPSDLPNDLGLPVLDPDAMAGHEPTSDFHRPAADDVAVLMMSSGSTGAPKIVQLTHRGLVEFAAGTPAMLPVRPGQTTLNWLPLDQSGAFLLYHLLPVFTGCTNIHVNTGWVRSNPLRWLDLMDQHRVNHSWSPNFGYRLATQAIAGEPDRHWDLSALRSLVSGGEQITVPVMSEFLRLTNRFGVVPETFVAAWGMTETVTGITFARPGLTPNVHRVRIPPTGAVEWVDQRPASGKVAVARPGKARAEAPGVLSLVSVGAPAPGTTVRIVAPNGAVLPEGRIGQLQVASARVTPGYLGNLDADRTAFPIGNWPARKWLATGDQGFITGGQVVITGRDSERIIMSGKLYYAHDIETVAATAVGAEHGLVAACGIADAESGTDRLVVFYALTPESIPGMDQAIRSLIQGRLGLVAEVVGVQRRDFPTTPGGKILRPLLKQRWIDGTLESPPGPHVEPAGASSYSGPTGEGPSAAMPVVTDEDPAERTTELPVVRLAWKRTLQQSIPTPPQRPTLGARPDPTTPDPHPANPTTEAKPANPAGNPHPADLAADPQPVDRTTEAKPADPEAKPHPVDLAADPQPVDLAAEPQRVDLAAEGQLVDRAVESEPIDPVVDEPAVEDPAGGEVSQSVEEPESGEQADNEHDGYFDSAAFARKPTNPEPPTESTNTNQQPSAADASTEADAEPAEPVAQEPAHPAAETEANAEPAEPVAGEPKHPVAETNGEVAPTETTAAEPEPGQMHEAAADAESSDRTIEADPAPEEETQLLTRIKLDDDPEAQPAQQDTQAALEHQPLPAEDETPEHVQPAADHKSADANEQPQLDASADENKQSEQDASADEGNSPNEGKSAADGGPSAEDNSSTEGESSTKGKPVGAIELSDAGESSDEQQVVEEPASVEESTAVDRQPVATEVTPGESAPLTSSKADPEPEPADGEASEHAPELVDADSEPESVDAEVSEEPSESTNEDPEPEAADGKLSEEAAELLVAEQEPELADADQALELEVTELDLEVTEQEPELGDASSEQTQSSDDAVKAASQDEPEADAAAQRVAGGESGPRADADGETSTAEVVGLESSVEGEAVVAADEESTPTAQDEAEAQSPTADGEPVDEVEAAAAEQAAAAVEPAAEVEGEGVGEPEPAGAEAESQVAAESTPTPDAQLPAEDEPTSSAETEPVAAGETSQELSAQSEVEAEEPADDELDPAADVQSTTAEAEPEPESVGDELAAAVGPEAGLAAKDEVKPAAEVESTTTEVGAEPESADVGPAAEVGREAGPAAEVGREAGPAAEDEVESAAEVESTTAEVGAEPESADLEPAAEVGREAGPGAEDEVEPAAEVESTTAEVGAEPESAGVESGAGVGAEETSAEVEPAAEVGAVSGSAAEAEVEPGASSEVEGDARSEKAAAAGVGTAVVAAAGAGFGPERVARAGVARVVVADDDVPVEDGAPAGGGADAEVSSVAPTEPKQVAEPEHVSEDEVPAASAEVVAAQDEEAPAAQAEEVPAAQAEEAPAAQAEGVPATRGEGAPAAQDGQAPAAQAEGVPAAQGEEAPAALDEGAPAAPDGEVPAAQDGEAPAAQVEVGPVAHDERGSAAQDREAPAAQAEVGSAEHDEGASAAQVETAPAGQVTAPAAMSAPTAPGTAPAAPVSSSTGPVSAPAAATAPATPVSAPVAVGAPGSPVTAPATPVGRPAAVSAPASPGTVPAAPAPVAAPGSVAAAVAVVGVAGRFPGAETLEQFWDNLVGGVESVRRVELEDGGEGAVSGVLDHVESFDAKFFGLSDREAELMDPAQRLFLEVCHQALEHGGYAGTSSRVGVFAGSGMNLYNRQHQSRDSIATRVAYRLGLTGPAIGVQSAWSSSLVAVHLACQALRSGDADLALAGAAAVQVPQATSHHPDPDSILSPSGHVRAFAADADGTVGGNGVAAVLLKRLDQAVADGDTVYAVIRGTAVSNEDAPAGNEVERALERAGFEADSLSYIEANAIGSTTGDAAEIASLTTALRRHTDKVGFCTIGSVKPNIGHLDSAAGMAGLIKTILMLQHRTLVPTINYTTPNPDLALEGSPFVIGTDVRDWEAGTTLRAGVSALDAGGTNAHVILEEAPRQIRRGDDGPVALALSAPDPDALADLVELYRTDLDHGTGHRLIDLAGTAALGRPAHRHRVAVAGASEAELVDSLGSAQAAEVPRGGPGPLGYAFTGQGAARRGMAAGLAARFPAFRSVLDECDRVYHEETGGSLLELLLTPAGTSEGVWPTETAQPALFAFELALARLWQSFGVQPALVVGHSVGEYAALCVAGALSTADGVRLTAKRGELMQRGTVPGAMVAVRADADRVREIAQTTGVEVAAGNGPQSFVLTGSEVIVGQLAEQLDRLEVSWQRLEVDRAFHSSLVDPILADFAEIVRGITLKPLRTPMVSSWSGDLLESGTVLDGDYLVGQLRQPVLFGDAVEAVTAAGCRRFLELGPDAVLSPAGRRIAPNSTWIPAQRLGQDPVLATMNGLVELYEQGTEIAWSKVYPDGGRVPLPTYPFRRVHHPVDPSVTVGAVAAGETAQRVPTPFERAARAQTVVFEPSSAAVKRIPLDPPDESTAEDTVEETADESPFALPAETHAIDADYLAQAGALSGDEVSAERYRESLDAVLDLTCAELNLDPYDLTVDHTFAELGATPASMAPVIDEINTRFAVELSPDELFGLYTTPHKLATAVAIVAEDNEPALQESVEQPEAIELGVVEVDEVPEPEPEPEPVRDPRAALAVLGSGLAELAAKVDEAAAATSEAELPGSGMAALMSQQLRVAGQLVDGVTQLMREQLSLLNENTPEAAPAAEPDPDPAEKVAETGAETVAEAAPETAAQAEAARRRDLAYWDLALSGAEPLVLPADRVRPAAEPGVASVKQELDEDLGDAVFVFSRERKVSPPMTMLAAVGTVLGRFAAQDDVTIGSALIRPQADTSTTTRRALPLRIDLSGEPDLGELAQRVRDVTSGAFDHAGTDLGILEREPLFQILVEFEDGDDELPPAIDLRLRLTHHGAGITCTADYRPALFEQSTIDRLLAYLEAVLRRATTQPRLRLPDLMHPIEADLEKLRELEGEVEPTGLLGRVRRDAVVAGELSGLHTLFEQQVSRTPDAIALIQGDRELTYAELDRRSNAVAWQLTDLGVRPGQLVAVRVARGTELVVAVLAVLKSGAAYLPLDPGVPESRWAFMVQDASAVALVGDDAGLADRLGLRLVQVAPTGGDPRSRQAPPVRAAADDVAYCIYTSGSTGNPKGVVVPHRGPVNLVRHYLRTRRSLRTLQWTSFGFDVHVQEMFTTLASGSALVLIGEDDRYDPDAVIAALRDHGVERLFMAFSPLTALLATMRRLPELPALREIVAGGEAMVLTHKVRDFLDAHPECALFNEYGPAEASIVTTIHAVDPAEDRPSIGRPVEGVVVRLLDEALRPVPVGAVGEIHLGGAAIAQGYIGRPEETERAFVPDPGHLGGRLYRSRDLGRWRVDGTLEYLGRADDQVKIRGHRVEPGETEHVLADQAGVVDAVVVACADQGGETCLIGYVVLDDSDPAVLARLMLDLGKELPIYLVPADLIPIEELPLDDNGRLDRSRLPEPEWLRP